MSGWVNSMASGFIIHPVGYSLLMVEPAQEASISCTLSVSVYSFLWLWWISNQESHFHYQLTCGVYSMTSLEPFVTSKHQLKQASTLSPSFKLMESGLGWMIWLVTPARGDHRSGHVLFNVQHHTWGILRSHGWSTVPYMYALLYGQTQQHVQRRSTVRFFNGPLSDRVSIGDVMGLIDRYGIRLFLVNPPNPDSLSPHSLANLHAQ